MPNHITTAVEITGSKESIAKLIEDTKIILDPDVDQNEFDFNGIIPMPKGLNIESGSNTDLGLAAFGKSEPGKMFSMGIEQYSKLDWFKKKYPGVTTAEEMLEFLENSDDENDGKILELGKQASENIDKYGHATWYEWANRNWGTKWNAYDVQYIAHDDNHLVLKITTAWDTPHPIWNKLMEMGFQVNGIYYGEMEGTGEIGDGGPFYSNVAVEYADYFSDYEGEE